MPVVESTAAMVEATYEKMERNLTLVRTRAGKPLTLTDKLLLGHLDDAEQQEIAPGESYLLLRPDRVVLPDAIGQVTMLQFIQTGQDRVRLPTTVHCDHLTQAQTDGKKDLAASLDQNREIYDFLRYLAASGRGELTTLVERFKHLLVPDEFVEAAPEKHYDRVISLDLSALEPFVTGPHSPDRTRPISALAAECRSPDWASPIGISSALIGRCTNSSYEDMSRAAIVAQQAIARGIKSAVPFLITPGSEQVRATIERDGQMKSLQEIGGVVLANACGPCIGQWKRGPEVAGIPNTIVTSYNRNYPGRNDGQSTTMHFMASPEIVTAFALAGSLSFNPLIDTLTDEKGNAFVLEPPDSAPEVPASGFAERGSFYTAPPADGRDVVLAIDPASERLQVMEPWDAWNDGDFVDMPVLIKTKGKTTTDQIAPAGPWMRYRGHIGKSSDGLLLGAVNAHTQDIGKVANMLSGEKSQPVAKVARDYQAKNLKWVIVGGDNYGEGSSREHAAITPRYLGCAAVIARSFARIHESNLKKQGLLPLVFRNPEDYDRIREDDRISLTAIVDIAPGVDVECHVQHADGTRETLSLGHSLSANHLRWFRAGSALNALLAS